MYIFRSESSSECAACIASVTHAESRQRYHRRGAHTYENYLPEDRAILKNDP